MTSRRAHATFGYLRDPLFVACCAVYAANRCVIKVRLPHDETFFRGHLNDLLIIPCALPPLLYLYRWLGLRDADVRPTVFEVALHVVVWSMICEWVGPAYLARGTADVLDVAAYCAGGAVSWVAWNRATVAELWRPRA